MKAITIYQPWASLVAVGVKKFETRGWETSYRGPIAIHAGKKPVLPWFQREVEKRTRLAIISALAPHHLGVLFTAMPFGAVIATAELVGCYRIEDNPMLGIGYYKDGKFYQVSEQEHLLGDYTPGRSAWELANVKMIDEPVPAVGRQRLWNWDEEGL